MAYFYPSYMRMSAKALHKYLIKRKTPDVVREQIEEVCYQQREQRRKQRIKETLRAQAWGDLIEPLREELRTSKASYRYHMKNDDEPSCTAFAAYIMQMERLLKNLTRLQTKTDDRGYASPLSLARQAKLPNDGEHWSDWLSDDKKQSIRDLFSAVPYKHKAKRKEPYPRVLTLAHRIRKNDKALSKAQAEEAAILRELTVRNADRAKNTRLFYIEELEAQLRVVQLDVVRLTKQKERLDHESRPKEQRNPTQQAAVENEGDSGARAIDPDIQGDGDETLG